jgi:anti-anti-sigma regulatory factor
MSTLTITQKADGETLTLTFAGQIDEAARYDGVSTKGFKRITMDFEKIKLINSTGLQAWIKFFQTVEKAAAVAFVNCSIRLITQINMFPGFMAGRQVRILSFFAPYFCEACDQSCDVLVDATKHGTLLSQTKAPAMQCPRCHGQAEFDGIEKKYFLFLKSA